MKLKFKGITQVRKNLLNKESWLKVKRKKKDLKCENCKRPHGEVDGDIGLMTGKGVPNLHICSECGDAYIDAGAEDLEAKLIKRKARIEELLVGLDFIGYKAGYLDKPPRDLDLQDLEDLYASQSKIKAEKDRIAAIVIPEEDATMEPYLEKDYGVIQDTEYLKCEEQIKPYFAEDAREHFDCGQGYFQDEAIIIAKIGRKFYEVKITADICSAKQDVGDRLYWVEGIEKVEWKEIPKPEPKQYQVYDYSFSLNPDRKKELDSLLSSSGFKALDNANK